MTEVKAAVVLQQDVPIFIEAIGQTRGSTEIEVRARVEGFVESVDFKEGSLVRKGQLLYRLDPRPFEASLAQAKGTLAEAQARFERTRPELRCEPLVCAKNAISRQEYETSGRAAERRRSLDERSQSRRGRGADRSRLHQVPWPPRRSLVSRGLSGQPLGRGRGASQTRISQIETIQRPVHPLRSGSYLFYAKRRPGAGQQLGPREGFRSRWG